MQIGTKICFKIYFNLSNIEIAFLRILTKNVFFQLNETKLEL